VWSSNREKEEKQRRLCQFSAFKIKAHLSLSLSLRESSTQSSFRNIHKSNVWLIAKIRCTKTVERCQLSICLCLCIYMYVWICLQASGGRCAKTELSSYGSCETENKRCGSCILTTKRVTQTNYYDTNTHSWLLKFSNFKFLSRSGF